MDNVDIRGEPPFHRDGRDTQAQEVAQLLRTHEDLVPLDVEHHGWTSHRVHEPDAVCLEELHLFGEDRVAADSRYHLMNPSAMANTPAVDRDLARPGRSGNKCRHRRRGPGHRHLLVRRNRSTGELAFHRCYSATHVPLSTLVKVAGRRWTAEEIFQSGKGLAALDEHQVRRWTSWHRWVTLAMLAHAFLTAATADERARTPAPDGLIPLICNEIQHLFTTLVTQPSHAAAHRLHWSRWRRRLQARSRASPYRRRTVLT